MNFLSEDTLPDDAWKDSFDKLLDQRPELNIIKPNIRASFNMNSSYENSSYDNSGSTKLDCDLLQRQQNEPLMNLSPVLPNIYYLDVPKNINTKCKRQITNSKAVSTPVNSSHFANPFKCTLSPIGSWDMRFFKCNDKENKKVTGVGFNATPVIDNVEYIEDVNSPRMDNEIYRSRYSSDVSPLALVRKKWKTKESQKRVCWADNNVSAKNEKPPDNMSQDVGENMSPPLSPKVGLQPGKWRKSLNCLRRLQNPIRENDADLKLLRMSYQKRESTVVERPKSLTTASSVGGKRKSVYIRSSQNETRTSSRTTYSQECNDFKRQVLQRCGQRRILSFSSVYNEDYLRNCCKIGEGAFGEVFLYSKPKGLRTGTKNAEKTVFKIIPIEGKELVNGEVQKTFEEILPEIIISMELCGLNNSNRKMNVTSGFVNIQKVRCVYGQYPSYLQKLWEEYDLEKESENDHPKCFTNDQLYIILELGFGGQDLESFRFQNAEQSFCALQQIIMTLAVGEKEYQFEHRDLHCGNVLVLNTNQEYIAYKLDGNKLTIPTKGIKIAIIDYTLSRMTFNDYCFYNDLSNDEELFSATGDYQFEIYRLMREAVNNKWEAFDPKTNIFWVSYIISKLVEGVMYKNIRSQRHLTYIGKLKQLQTSILTYKSCDECARDMLLY